MDNTMKSEHDKYYTPDTMIAECIDALKETIDFATIQKIIEPSAGDGRWLTALQELCDNVDLYDIAPDNDKVKKLDFLKETLFAPSGTVFVGNPPFGKACSLANKFFDRAAEYKPEYIAFIIPRSFGKRLSHRRKLDHAYSPVKVVELSGEHFIRPDGVSYTGTPLKCDFQIWKRGPRAPVAKPVPVGYDVVKGKSVKIIEDGVAKEMPVGYDNRVQADFSIHTHGKNVGRTTDFKPMEQKPNVYQFVKVWDGYSVEEIRKKFDSADYSYFLDASLGDHQRSLSTDEIIYCVEGIDIKLI